MKQRIIRNMRRLVPAVIAAAALTGCDAHIKVLDTAVRPAMSSAWTERPCPTANTNNPGSRR